MRRSACPRAPVGDGAAARRAVVTGLALLLSGWLIGGGLGLWSSWVGMGAVALVVFLGGSAWAAHRVGKPGVLAGLIGTVAGIGAAIEVDHAQAVTRARLTAVATVNQWQPGSFEGAELSQPLKALPRFEAWLTRQATTGKTRTTNTVRAVPLIERAGGPIVAWTCASSPGALRLQGQVVLQTSAITQSTGTLCSAAFQQVAQKAAAAGYAVASGAEAREVLLFDSEAQLRSSHGLAQAVGLPAALWLLYALGVVVFRARLAR